MGCASRLCGLYRDDYAGVGLRGLGIGAYGEAHGNDHET